MYEMFQPLATQMSELQSSMSKIEQSTETALEVSFAAQEDIRALQHHENWVKEKLLTLENTLYQHQLKFCGIPEEEEGTIELSIFMANWLASVQNLENEVSSTIIKAHRMSKKNHPNFKGPRDILMDNCTEFYPKPGVKAFFRIRT